MATLTIPNIPPHVMAVLERTARALGTTVEQEAARRLEAILVTQDQAATDRVLAELRLVRGKFAAAGITITDEEAVELKREVSA